jgi:hypothetical protein
MCFDPDFIDPNPVTVTGLTTADANPTDIAYAGSIETGITLTLNVNRTLGEFTVYHTDPVGNVLSMDIVGSFVSGDVITVSTVPGAKVASLNRAGVITSILYGVSPQSIWFKLTPGDNLVKVYATGAAIPVTIVYTNRFGGL